MARLRLALFDVDGTLVDSQAHITHSMAAAFASEGLTPPAHDEVLSIVGLSLPNAIAQLAPAEGPRRIDRLVSAYKSAYAALRQSDGAQQTPLYPGARACLQALADVPDILLGVATGKSRRGLDALIELHGLERMFLTQQVADDHPSKPHPSMILTAMAELGVAPEDTIMIGDTSYDMTMACAAGVRRLGVAWGYHPAAELRAAGAEQIATSYAEVPDMLNTLWETTNG